MPLFKVPGLIGSDGRAAVLAEAYSKNPHVGRIIAVPGNDMMHLNLREGVVLDRVPLRIAAETAFAMANALHGKGATSADICQDDAIAGGTVNWLKYFRTPVLGPTKEAGRVEWDKAYARDVMKRCGIPHPAFTVCRSEAEGVQFLDEQPDQRWAVKASGLALGKGVILCADSNEARAAVSKMAGFGTAGETFLIEEFIDGEEFSMFAASDGRDFRILGSAQDHKRAYDGDTGPNTGGMGAYSNPSIVTPDVERQSQEIMQKLLTWLANQGTPYVGILYMGGMVKDGNVKVVEFNSRWGDPEAEVIVPSIQSDMLSLSEAMIEGRIRNVSLSIDKRVRVAVALTAKNYPGNVASSRGKEIFGVDFARAIPNVKVYGAGTAMTDGRYYANGGRLLYVVGEGEDIVQAREAAYEGMRPLRVDDGEGHYRTDIAHRELARMNQPV